MRRISVGVIVILAAIMIIVIINLVQAAGSDPGSESDPLVSSSYLDGKITELKTYIDTKVTESANNLTITIKTLTDKIDEFTKNSNEGIEKRIKALEDKLGSGGNNSTGNNLQPNGNQPSRDIFMIVNIKAKEKLICSISTELILRAGKATAITSQQGGISDITGGKDIKEKEQVLCNHLIIIPRDDGRGLLATTDCVIMVKGSYEVK
jgi:hypothetical protein